MHHVAPPHTPVAPFPIGSSVARAMLCGAILLAGNAGSAAGQSQSASDLWNQPRPPGQHDPRGPHFGGEARMGMAWSNTDGFRFVSSAELTFTFTARTGSGLRFGGTVPVPPNAWQPDLSPGR